MADKTVFLRTTHSNGPSVQLDKRLAAAVSNTGNFFFEEALEGHLANFEICQRLSDLPADTDTLVLSMSNFLSPFTDLGSFHDEIVSKKIDHVVMIGAGAQADTYEDEITLTDGTLKFVRMLSERSVSIGVRGFYTAEVLADLGIRNVDVIGCPTAFWHDSKPVARKARAPEKLAIHCTPSGHFKDNIGALISHGMRNGANYVIQSEKWMLALVTDELAHLADELRSRNHAAYYLKGYVSTDEFISWLNDHYLIYFGMDEWTSSMREYDFVYGSRFHGNMAAIQSGTPALNMPFDTRTRELCEYLNLPMLPLEKFDGSLEVDQLLDLADFSTYNRTYQARFGEYVKFLSKNGLELLSQP